MSPEKEVCISCSEVFPITETVTDDDGRPICWPCFQDNERAKERHQSGCICADCSGADLTADND